MRELREPALPNKDAEVRATQSKVSIDMQSDSGAFISSAGVLPHLFALNDGSWRWSAGVEAALANALVMTTFSLAGELSLGLIASLGAFTGLYGTSMLLHERLRRLPLVATGVVAASVLGVLCATNAFLTIACMIFVALLASMLVFGAGLGPPGPMQFVLVAGVSARLAAHASVGASSFEAFEIPVLVALGALSAYIVAAARAALSLIRSQKDEIWIAVPLFSVQRLDAEKLTITARVVFAVAAAGLLSFVLRMHHGYWMALVAGAVLQATDVSRHSMLRTVQRVLGTVAGVLVFGLIQFADPRGAWLIGLVVLLQFAIEVVVARNYALALSFITPTALTIAASAGTSVPGSLVTERIVDTLLGATIAMIVLWISQWTRKRNCSFLCSRHRNDH